MKKVLIGILIFLLFVMAYFAIFRGISIGPLEILSVEQIAKENDELTKDIQEVQTLMFTTYQAATDKLDKSVSSLLEAKNEYLDLASVSTEGELSQANQEEIYTMEYLWTKIGRHATAEGVNLKLDLYAGETGESDVKNMNFTVSGYYIATINFIEALEDDSKLGFRIENFKMLPGGEDSRQTTFTVRNVKIKQENASAGPSAGTSTSTTGQNRTTTSNNETNSTISNNQTNTTTQSNNQTNTTTQQNNQTNSNQTTNNGNAQNSQATSTSGEEVTNPQ